MDHGALPVRWWADDAFATPWPAASVPAACAVGAAVGAGVAGGAAAGVAGGAGVATGVAAAVDIGAVRIVGVRGCGDRVAARRAIRIALAAALADSTGLPDAAIRLVAEPGAAPSSSVSCKL